PSAIRPGRVPIWLEEVIEGLLVKQPDERLQPARRVMELLELGHTIERGSSPGAIPREWLPPELAPPPPPPPAAFPSVGVWVALGCAGLLALVGAGGAVVTLGALYLSG